MMEFLHFHYIIYVVIINYMTQTFKIFTNPQTIKFFIYFFSGKYSLLLLILFYSNTVSEHASESYCRCSNYL